MPKGGGGQWNGRMLVGGLRLCWRVGSAALTTAPALLHPQAPRSREPMSWLLLLWPLGAVVLPSRRLQQQQQRKPRQRQLCRPQLELQVAQQCLALP